MDLSQPHISPSRYTTTGFPWTCCWVSPHGDTCSIPSVPGHPVTHQSAGPRLRRLWPWRAPAPMVGGAESHHAFCSLGVRWLSEQRQARSTFVACALATDVVIEPPQPVVEASRCQLVASMCQLWRLHWDNALIKEAFWRLFVNGVLCVGGHGICSPSMASCVCVPIAFGTAPWLKLWWLPSL